MDDPMDDPMDGPMDGPPEDNIVRLPVSGGAASTTKLLRKLSWLDGWNGSDKPPVPADEIRRLIADLAEQLRPAGDEGMAVLLEPLSDLFGAPGPEVTKRTFEALADLPANALAIGVERCMRECRGYPYPVDIRDRAWEYKDLRLKQLRLGTALWILTRGW